MNAAENSTALHEWASTFTGMQKITGAVWVVIICMMLVPRTRGRGVYLAVAAALLMFATNLRHPGTFNGARLP